MVILLAMPLQTTTRRTAPWDPDIARRYLDDVLHERAACPGISDRTLERLAALADPMNPNKAAFVLVLNQAGWSPKRIARACAEVTALSRPRVDALGTLRNVGAVAVRLTRDYSAIAILVALALIAAGAPVAGCAMFVALLLSCRKPPEHK